MKRQLSVGVKKLEEIKALINEKPDISVRELSIKTGVTEAMIVSLKEKHII